MPANPRTKSNPKDFTGTQKQRLAAKHAEEIAQRQGELSMRAQVQRAALDTPVVLDETGREVSVAAEVADGPVRVEKEFAEIKLACDLEHVTVGQGTNFSFEEGQSYVVPSHVADHLERLGYVWTRK